MYICTIGIYISVYMLLVYTLMYWPRSLMAYTLTCIYLQIMSHGTIKDNPMKNTMMQRNIGRTTIIHSDHGGTIMELWPWWDYYFFKTLYQIWINIEKIWFQCLLFHTLLICIFHIYDATIMIHMDALPCLTTCVCSHHS